MSKFGIWLKILSLCRNVCALRLCPVFFKKIPIRVQFCAEFCSIVLNFVPNWPLCLTGLNSIFSNVLLCSFVSYFVPNRAQCCARFCSVVEAALPHPLIPPSTQCAGNVQLGWLDSPLHADTRQDQFSNLEIVLVLVIPQDWEYESVRHPCRTLTYWLNDQEMFSK